MLGEAGSARDWASLIDHTLLKPEATDEEVECAATAVLDALQHPLLARVRQSPRVHRELPISIPADDASIFEGVIDLAFLEAGKWIVADFKTDVDRPGRQLRYRRQVGWYVKAMEQVTGVPSTGCVLHL